MLNQTTAPEANTQNEGRTLKVTFQDFNGVFIAKISNSIDQETFAYGATKDLAKRNAVLNYRTKYATLKN